MAIDRDQVITDERLDSLERYRGDNDRWKADMDKRFADAFPGGDHVGHCRYHTLQIKQIEETRSLRQAILAKTISGLVWSGIVGLAAAAWFYLKAQIKGG